MIRPSRLIRTAPRAKPGIVHIGPGAFFKAFNAVYTDDLLRAQGGDWGIIAVSLQSDRAARALHPQDCAYTAVTLGPEGSVPRVVNAVSDVLVSPDDPQAVLAALANPDIKIVSLTITEKGYCRDAATGGLNRELSQILDDLSQVAPPRTAPGLIVAGLALRWRAGLRPFTVLSCDNLPDNGAVARQVVLDYARALDPDLAAWIAAEACFPATMVDRITPATQDEDIARLTEQTGTTDAACVFHEPFRQWVIEDQFVDGLRPAWDQAGAQFVTSVAAHETMKLRCLNGTHSTLAYLGYLAGYETIAQTVADPDFAQLCEILWETEILPTVPQPQGEDLPGYTAALLERYRNPAIQHRTWQIAMDGSQKLPQRLLAPIAERRAAGTVPKGLCLAVAAWMRYVGGVDEKGQAIDVRDPLAVTLREVSDAAGTVVDTVQALLWIKQIFPSDLAQDVPFATAVTQAYAVLAQQGAKAAVQAFVANAR
ncbi:MAG: mannitol dehydrogenase family protein [Roseobacter sp.]